jgi:hypothetical protein
MTQSVTGTGLGSSGQVTSKELAMMANGPTIFVAERIELEEDFMVNPPAPTATVTFPEALTGSYTNYTVLVTGINTGAIYIASMDDNDDDNFSGFRVIGESEGTCMYTVIKTGLKPKV